MKLKTVKEIPISDVKELILLNYTIFDILNHYGFSPYGGSRKTLQNILDQNDLSCVKSANINIENKDMLYFTNPSPVVHTTIRKYVRKHNKIPYQCAVCNNLGMHLGNPLTLQLDHINGINNDNRLENLRFLCPNCHSQTVTYGYKNTNNILRETTKIKKEKKIKPYITRKESLELKRKTYTDVQMLYIDKVLQSGIDFSTYGWATKVGPIIDQPVQAVKKWMLAFMPEFYVKNCYKRKSFIAKNNKFL